MRRFPVERLAPGSVGLDATQSRHLRDVLRLGVGASVELFDSSGQRAIGVITALSPQVQLRVEEITARALRGIELTIAAAPPKGPRADWMIEKLSELGVTRYIPLQSARTIVHPETGKLTRWQRLASESAKQCRRDDIMSVEAPASVAELCAASGSYDVRWCLATETAATAIADAMGEIQGRRIVAAIGPEGGWTQEELAAFSAAGYTAIALTSTILRIETAAIALAALVLTAKEV